VLQGGDPVSIVRELTREPQTADSLLARGVLAPTELAKGLDGLAHSDNWYFRPEWLEELQATVRRRLDARLAAEPLDPGLSVGELLAGQPWATAVLPLLELERRDGKAYLPGTTPALGARTDEAERAEAELEQAGFGGAKLADAELARYLEREGRLVRLGDGLAVSRAAHEDARQALVEECERSGSITLARFRDLLGISRRPAQLLLERFDADGVTRRVGDERVLRRAARG
jgi:selenocysteine-specific elongation factor